MRSGYLGLVLPISSTTTSVSKLDGPVKQQQQSAVKSRRQGRSSPGSAVLRISTGPGDGVRDQVPGDRARERILRLGRAEKATRHPNRKISVHEAARLGTKTRKARVAGGVRLFLSIVGKGVRVGGRHL